QHAETTLLKIESELRWMKDLRRVHDGRELLSAAFHIACADADDSVFLQCRSIAGVEQWIELQESRASQRDRFGLRHRRMLSSQECRELHGARGNILELIGDHAKSAARGDRVLA